MKKILLILMVVGLLFLVMGMFIVTAQAVSPPDLGVTQDEAASLPGLSITGTTQEAMSSVLPVAGLALDVNAEVMPTDKVTSTGSNPLFLALLTVTGTILLKKRKRPGKLHLEHPMIHADPITVSDTT